MINVLTDIQSQVKRVFICFNLGSCEPNCSNGGVCFKDNTCRCKIFTEGTQCERCEYSKIE